MCRNLVWFQTLLCHFSTFKRFSGPLSLVSFNMFQGLLVWLVRTGFKIAVFAKASVSRSILVRIVALLPGSFRVVEISVVFEPGFDEWRLTETDLSLRLHGVIVQPRLSWTLKQIANFRSTRNSKKRAVQSIRTHKFSNRRKREQIKNNILCPIVPLPPNLCFRPLARDC